MGRQSPAATSTWVLSFFLSPTSQDDCPLRRIKHSQRERKLNHHHLYFTGTEITWRQEPANRRRHKKLRITDKYVPSVNICYFYKAFFFKNLNWHYYNFLYGFFNIYIRLTNLYLDLPDLKQTHQTMD